MGDTVKDFPLWSCGTGKKCSTYSLSSIIEVKIEMSAICMREHHVMGDRVKDFPCRVMETH